MFKSNKFKRFYYILIVFISLVSATFFVLKALEEKIVFFYTPTKLKENNQSILGYIRIGGIVEKNSITFSKNGLMVNFSVSDNKNLVNVTYEGILPDLFREEQGVVVEGSFDKEKKVFFAKKVLAKHDENYMPPQVKKALEREK